ncbi:MAG: cytochrome c biogenesis protein CcsA [Actinomycetota bacterium]
MKAGELTRVEGEGAPRRLRLSFPDRSQRALRILSLLVGAGMLIGLAAIFLWAPTEAFQGEVQRIVYVHVPTAWVAYLAFTVVLIGSIAHLKSGSARWDALARASAEVGVLFSALNLVTGMIWGRPIWNTYWTWDPRLTTAFVLFLIYVGYLVFRALATDPARGARISAVIGIVGFVDIPIVHFSAVWWRGLHPARTLIDPGGAPPPPRMLATIVLMVGVFTLLYALLLSLRIRLAGLESEVTELEAAGG